MSAKLADKPKEQIDKFREAARELETDESEEAFDRIVKKVAKKPSENDGKSKQ
ncbi:hypothetical protein [Nitratireductor pacificus]|uniref:hypothetical protein n=1 Tax=Nitratireductor pacificus TaxID=1231180 RepID=UPI0002FB56FF|nr:hypothetical protein [Nitratireductor pacificus]